MNKPVVERIYTTEERTQRIYRVIRYTKHGSADSLPMQTTSRTIKTLLTLPEAQAHCQDPESRTARYVDRYDFMKVK